MATHRIFQINELIKKELSQILLREDLIPAGHLVTITKADTTRDLSQARITISILPNTGQEEILHWLQKKAGPIQHLLGKKIILRKIPKILFELDKTLENVSHIDSLIDKIHRDE
ncbi:MAG: 30S ribosome-binding factor RbfA [Patescibacteria group bacterium]|jgi:ribosome-binding factor A